MSEGSAAPNGAAGIRTSKTPAQLRDDLQAMVIRDLLGPAGGPEEEVPWREAHAYTRYLVGMLAPQATGAEAATFDDLGTAGTDDPEVGLTEPATPSTNTFFPSSMGMSFTVADEVKEIVVETEWGRYLREPSATAVDRADKPRLVWKRRSVVCQPIPLELKPGNFGPLTPDPAQPFVVLQGRARKAAGSWIVTLFLVNQQEELKQKKDEAWVFQPKVSVRAADTSAVFAKRLAAKIDTTRMDPITAEETETLAMLYRRQLEFAVGHGVSIHATTPAEGAERATRIETTFVPMSEVPQQTTPTIADNPDLSGLVLDMKELAEMPDEKLFENLRILALAYSKWIARQEVKKSDPAERLADHQPAATRALERCQRANTRIQEGIDLLRSDRNARQAFRFANQAMWLQRTRSIFARKVRKKELKIEDGTAGVDVPGNRSWRPFQLAFVLLNLPGLTDLHHPHRSHETEAVTDLLWFPTGGGKTEAYLGLTAFVLALRRLQGVVEGRPGDHGVAVLMRYTLRLLTVQQFQRGAALLCACEVIRRGKPEVWGTTHFRLGLWVGAKTTPNKLAHAAEALAKGNIGGKPFGGGTPHQITSCPWCGSEVTENDIRVLLPPSNIGRAVTYCGDPLGRCEFSAAKAPSEGLPVMVVDEEIYRRPPSVLLATVDKFAQMPWKGEVQMLFGRVNGLCPRHGFLSPEIEDAVTHREEKRYGLPGAKRVDHGLLRPPDLVIQDELHLISGRLGSMVGLYETAIDELCSWTVGGRKVRPKVIASTATIRRAPDQVKKLFVRKLEVFPPQGIDIRDNFFALQRQSGPQFPGRRYLGLCAFGRRYPAALIRVYLAFMGAAQRLYDAHDTGADPWMTLAGYFNSIRELAGTRRLVEDDIRWRLRDADQRGLAKRQIRYGAVEELTSRKSGADIPKILERLEILFNKAQEAQRQADRKASKKVETPDPYDVILATNMISVGVDIDRLGLMIVAGQPKTTSEYIQATSRVGRSAASPGIVCTLYNWARPRDLSHFETFEHYHQTFYQHVEALSLTPFSERALDRGLSGVLVGLMRLYEDRLNENKKAGDLQNTDALLPRVFDWIADRAVRALDDPAAGVRVRKMLADRRDEWLKRVRLAVEHRLGYQAEAAAVVNLLEQPAVKDWQLFTCLNSLRDVEGTVNLILAPQTFGLQPDTGSTEPAPDAAPESTAEEETTP